MERNKSINSKSSVLAASWPVIQSSVKGAFKFLRAKQPPPASFAMADHEEPALPPQPTTARAAPNPAVPVSAVEPLDVPTRVTESEVTSMVTLSILLSVG